jgi:SAM-dependent methyltransferase
VAGPEEVRRERELLWEFHLARVRPATPVRFLYDRTIFSQAPPLSVVACRDCGTLYRHPREAGATVVDTYAAEEVDPAVLGELFRAQRPRYRRQLRRLRRLAGDAGRALEVGSYTGAFLAAAEGSGWHVDGIDVNPGAAGFARSRGLSAACGTLEALPRDGGYDAVAIWNCFEQLPDPRGAAAIVRGLLRPGGVLALRVPNGAFYAALRRRLTGPVAPLALRLLAWNNLLAFPYRAGFTPTSIARLLRASGFRVLAIAGEVLSPLASEQARRWAAWEECGVKALLRALAPLDAPWIEVYARVKGHQDRI